MTQQTNSQVKMRRDHHLTLTDKHPHRIANILIVDDDVDAAMAVQKTFGQMGCNIEFALDASEARRKIISGKADIIILDWMLDHRISADEIIAGAVERMRRFGGGRNGHSHRIKVVTYSRRPDTEVSLPESIFFEHVGHWQKPIRYPELIRKTLTLMNRMGF